MSGYDSLNLQAISETTPREKNKVSVSFVDNFLYETEIWRRRFTHSIGQANTLGRFTVFRLIFPIHQSQSRSQIHTITNFYRREKAHSGIDIVFDAHSTTADGRNRVTDLGRFH